MTTLADKAILSGADNRPPMLEKDMYDSWKSIMELYMMNKQHERMILESVENEATQADCNVKATNTILQGLPPEVYALVSNHKVAKELWERIQLLMQGTSLTKQEREIDIKWMDADDQAILLGLPEDVYAAVDSCETGKEIWELVRQMMKGSDIGEQEKKAKLFNEGEKFTSTDGESIESYYHRFMQLMNDLKRNKHFPKNITANLKTSSNPRDRQIAQPGMNMSQDRQIQNIGGNGGNQFGQYAGQVAQNQEGYNAWQNGGIQVAQNAVQNAGVQNGGNQNGLVVVPWIANQNGPQLYDQAILLGLPEDVYAAVDSCETAKEIWELIAQPGMNMSQDRQIQNIGGNGENQFGQYAGQVAQNQEGYNAWQNGRIQVAQNAVQNNDNHVTSVAPSMVQSRGTVETSSAHNEETRAHQETVYRNLIVQVAQRSPSGGTLASLEIWMVLTCSKAIILKSWLWHQRLSHLNFDTINDFAKNDLVSGLPKFKYAKEHLCPSYDYSRYTWVHFLRTKDETPEQNGVVERRNRILVEVARTMLIFSHAPLSLWAEAIATACYTKNHSIIHRRFNKTPYELIQGRKPNISYLHVFGALCYLKNDR
nr:hypothetical protein [Tanacetum cinerariifolium]